MTEPQRPFLCPQCGGFAMGSMLEPVTFRVLYYECHSDQDGLPATRTEEELRAGVRRGKSCGWKGFPNTTQEKV